MERGEPEDGVGCGASGVVQELRDSRDDQLGKFGDHPAAAGRIAVEADGVRPENVRAVELERLQMRARRPGGELEREATAADPTTVPAVSEVQVKDDQGAGLPVLLSPDPLRRPGGFLHLDSRECLPQAEKSEAFVVRQLSGHHA